METAAFFALHCLSHDKIAHVDDITQLANLARCLAALEEALCLLVEDVEAVPCSFKTEIATHDTHVGAHNLPDFFHRLGDKHHLLGVLSALVVPLRDILAIGV